jgi:hypothetical protein
LERLDVERTGIFSKVYMKIAKHLIAIKFAQNKMMRNFHGSIYGVHASQMLKITSQTLGERRKKYAIQVHLASLV